MIKLVFSNSFEFNDAFASVVPLHSRGVDSSWLNKRASAPLFDFSKIKASDNETLVHLLALADGEFLGANRNGDYFPKEANQKYHKTFLKAHYFHDHVNDDPKHSFGRVVAAAHNDKMHRVELIVAIDNNKGAKDLDELEKKGEFGVSMACRVPYDICSICNNKAKTRAEYCKHASHMMGRILEDGRQVYVVNDHPDFFDISKVWRPADRVAYTFRKLDKAASDAIVGGAELAENLAPHLRYPVRQSSATNAKCAVLMYMHNIANNNLAKLARSALHISDLSNDIISDLKKSDSDSIFACLHSRGIFLTVDDFFKIAEIDRSNVKSSDIKKRVAGLLSSINTDKAKQIASNGSYDGCCVKVNSKTLKAACAIQTNRSVMSEILVSDSILKTAECGLSDKTFEKSAVAVDPKADLLAEEYVAYLTSFAFKAAECNPAKSTNIKNLTTLCALS